MTENRSDQPEPDPDAVRGEPDGAGLAGRRTASAPRRRRSASSPTPGSPNAFLSQAFLWMFAGLLLTAGVAYVVQTNPRLLEFAQRQLLPAVHRPARRSSFVITGAISRISATAALALFFVYAAIARARPSGSSSRATRPGSVATAFLSASAMFGAAAIYGHVTKRSLAALGGILFMGLIGLLRRDAPEHLPAEQRRSPGLISIVGVVLFTALTAYDVQRIQSGDLAARLGSMEKAAVIGALQLYLDFINLFLFMLRLLGGRD